MSSVSTINTFSAKLLTVNAPRLSGNGHRICTFGTVSGRGQPIALQCPEVTVPWGLDKWGAIAFSLDGHDVVDSPVQRLYQHLCALDELVLSTAVENSFKWFGAGLTRQEVAKRYDPLIREPSDPAYPPTFRAKPDDRTVYRDVSGKGVPTFPGKGKARVVIQPSFVYFREERFGFGIKLNLYWNTSESVRDESEFAEFTFLDE